MPVHDWRKVDAGTFHDFHCCWIAHIKEALNGGLLPPGYYARAEQHGSGLIGDVLAFQQLLGTGHREEPTSGGAALAEAPPRARKSLARRVQILKEPYRLLRRTVVIRHASGDRIVALIEIVSKANKDRAKSVERFADKVESALAEGIHVTMVDLLPPGPYDPLGMHEAIWSRFAGDESEAPPAEEPVTLAAYCADRQWPEAHLEYVAVGKPLPPVPVFLLDDRYVDLPLEATYQQTFRGLAAIDKDKLEATTKVRSRRGRK